MHRINYHYMPSVIPQLNKLPLFSEDGTPPGLFKKLILGKKYNNSY